MVSLRMAWREQDGERGQEPARRRNARMKPIGPAKPAHIFYIEIKITFLTKNIFVTLSSYSSSFITGELLKMKSFRF